MSAIFLAVRSAMYYLRNLVLNLHPKYCALVLKKELISNKKHKVNNILTENLKAHIYVFLATCLIAFSFIATNELAGVVDPISLTLYRFVLAFVILLPLMFIRFQELKVALKLVPGGLLVGLFYSAYFLAMFKALEVTSVLNTGTIYTLVPLMTAAMCLYFCREKIGLTQLLIYFLGLLATVIVIFEADIDLLLSLSLNHGDIIFIFGAFSMALYPIALKFGYPEYGVDPRKIAISA